ncbi:hypothetical protein PARU111607_16000 [Palleronia rufa]
MRREGRGDGGAAVLSGPAQDRHGGIAYGVAAAPGDPVADGGADGVRVEELCRRDDEFRRQAVAVVGSDRPRSRRRRNLGALGQG